MNIIKKVIILSVISLMILSICNFTDQPISFTARGNDYLTPVGINWTLNDISDLSSSTVTIKNGEFHIHQNITVNYGATLNIEPGTTIKFDRHKAIIIKGSLLAKGSSANKILITSSAAEKQNKDWGGLIFESRGENKNDSVIEHTDIEYGSTVIDCRSSSPKLSFVKITKSHIGVYGDSESSPSIINCEIINNNYWGIRLNRATSEISNSTISGNYYGLYSTGSMLKLTGIRALSNL